MSLRNNLKFLSFAILLIIARGAQGGENAEDTNLLKELEALRIEITQVRESLAKLQEDLDRIQRVQGMARYRFPRAVQLLEQSIPLERKDLWERMDKEFMIAVHDVPQVLLWIKRANRYFPFIQKRLQSTALPDDLKYVAIVESALRPEARSRAGAVGLWQFMPGTGTRYRLERSPWVDERLDPMQSTHAALAYLSDLYAMFGDWLLAVAAYNVGEERVSRELTRQNVDTYFDLVLPTETERYIFRIAAAKVILADPEVYGFELETEDLYDPVNTEPVEATVERGILDLIAMAGACGMTYRAFHEINPHFRTPSVPRGRYTMYLPRGKREQALKFIKNSAAKVAQTASTVPREEKVKIVHLVEPGETLSDIAKKYSVYVKSIKEWNQITNPNRINAGQRLIIYR